MLLYPVGSKGHVVHSGAPRERNMITLFFMIEWDRYRFEKKCAGTRYAELVSLHPVGYVGHVLHNDAFGVRIVDALFFMLVWALCDFHKKRAETR
jgi:hypothetical protein